MKYPKTKIKNSELAAGEGVEDLVAIELKRLDLMAEAIWDKASEGDTAAIDRLLKIAERRARMLGHDAEIKRQIDRKTTDNNLTISFDKGAE